ncbi:MAG: tetratricopeptide repeat protein [Desulfobacteraceae bacterium]|nr:tetratricopeptide repeat protein [Desulfobacteraceae bacterium]
MNTLKKTILILILGTALLLCGPIPGTALAAPGEEDLTSRARTALVDAQKQMELENPAQAKTVLQEFLQHHPKEDHHFVEFTLAGLLYNEDHLKEACDHYRKTVELNPEYGPGWQNLGKVCFDLKQFDEAAAAMETTYRLGEKKDPILLFHAAVAHISAKAPKKALEHMLFLTSGKAGEPKPNWVKILTSLAIELKCPKKALATVERLLKDPAPDPMLWRLAANLYLSMENYAESAKALAVYGMVHPLSTQEETLLADLYNRIGIPGKAADHYQRVLKKKPSRRLYERMVSARLEACDKDKALAAADKGVAAYPKSKVLWKLKGWICYERDQFDPAVKAFSRALELDRNDKKACFMKGLCASRSGAFETARQALKRASAFPEYKRQALSLIREMEQRAKKS